MTTQKKNSTTDEFGDDLHKNKAEDFGAMLEASLQGRTLDFAKGDKVDAEILSIGKNDIFVSVKGHDGVLPKVELQNEKGELKVQVGEKVSLYVIKLRDQLLYLTAKASGKALSESIEDAFDFETPVEGRVTEMVNGGFRVEVFHKIGFCPMSQMDSKPITEPESYIGKKFDFIVSEFAEGGRKLVLSRRRLLQAERAEKEGNFVERTEIGATVAGKVIRIETFGAFVEIESGVEGLLHISEIGWSRLAHPSEALAVGETVQVKILKIEEDDRGRLKISLSRKQASEDPWLLASQKLMVGQTVEGKLKEKAHFGWLIEIQPGIVALLPKSVLKESSDEKSVEQKRPGEKLRVVIGSISVSDRRISLSLPRSQDEGDWEPFAGPAASTAGKGMGTLADQFSNLFAKKSGK